MMERITQRAIEGVIVLAMLGIIVWGMTGMARAADSGVYRMMAVTNAGQQVAFTTGTLASGAALPDYTEAVRLVCDASCYVAVAAPITLSSIPITDVSGMVLPSNEPVTLLAAGNHHVIVIGVSGSGTLYVQALSK